MASSVRHVWRHRRGCPLQSSVRQVAHKIGQSKQCMEVGMHIPGSCKCWRRWTLESVIFSRLSLRLYSQWGPLNDSVQLVYSYNFIVVYGRQITIVRWDYTQLLAFGGSHCTLLRKKTDKKIQHRKRITWFFHPGLNAIKCQYVLLKKTLLLVK